MSQSKRGEQKLVFGAPPRADLLPPEVRSDVKVRKQRRGLVAIAVLAIVAVIVGYGASAVYLSSTQLALDSEHLRTDELLAEQAKYVAARQMSNQIVLSKKMQIDGTSTEIDWEAYLSEMESIMPTGMALASYTVSGSTPMLPFGVSNDPLQGPRVAEISFSGTTKDLSSVANWLDRLAVIEGFADAQPPTVTGEPGKYVFSVIVHLDEQAFAGRFLVAEEGEESE